MTVFILVTGIILTVSLIIFTIRMGRLTFASPIIIDQLRPGQTIYLEEGDYGLWGETRAFRFNRLLMEKPQLVDSRAQKVIMYYSIAGTHTRSIMGVARLLLYTFSVPSGQFTFQLEGDSPLVDRLAEVTYFIRVKTPLWCRMGFALGMFLSIASLVGTILLTVFSAIGMI